MFTARRSELLFISGANPDASFIAADRSLLRSLGASFVELKPGVGLRSRALFFRHLNRTLAHGTVRLVVVWFAAPGYAPLVTCAAHARRVPVLVVAGGAEVANCPDIAFGDARRWWRRTLVAGVLTRADSVWAFSEAASAEIVRLAPATRAVVVPPCVDTAFFQPLPTPREPLILTTCARVTRLAIRQKGLDRLIEAARVRSGLRVVVVGQLADRDSRVRELLRSAPANVSFTGLVDRATLRAWFARAHVYAQLSAHEGFGVAVAEATAMGCVPVVADLPSLRSVVQGDGLVVGGAASCVEIADVLSAGLARAPRSGQWQAIDRRFGPAVRRAAWLGELAHRGLTTHTA